MICIDANVFIYALAYNEKHPAAIKSKFFLAEVRFNRQEACTTLLTWDEVFWHLRQNRNNNGAIKAGRMLLSFPNLKFIDMTKKVIDDAQRICENYHVKPRDAIHGACALNHCEGKIFSNDGDFDSIHGISRTFK
jgi:predicted nucleic acid-binding protein